jgi:hypothetical protein
MDAVMAAAVHLSAEDTSDLVTILEHTNRLFQADLPPDDFPAPARRRRRVRITVSGVPVDLPGLAHLWLGAGSTTMPPLPAGSPPPISPPRGLLRSEFEVRTTPAGPDKCPICLETGADRRLVACPPAHAFHGECLWQWCSTHPRCPLCRRKARLEEEEEENAAAATDPD